MEVHWATIREQKIFSKNSEQIWTLDQSNEKVLGSLPVRGSLLLPWNPVEVMSVEIFLTDDQRNVDRWLLQQNSLFLSQVSREIINDTSNLLLLMPHFSRIDAISLDSHSCLISSGADWDEMSFNESRYWTAFMIMIWFTWKLISSSKFRMRQYANDCAKKWV